MHRRAPWLTTPSHPFVLVFYAALVIQGVLGVADLLNPESMLAMYGGSAVSLWSLARVAAGAFALAGATGATVSLLRQQDPVLYLWVEFVGCVLIALSQGMYEWTLYSRFGLSGVLETQVLTIAFALAGAARALQIPSQIRRFRAVQQRATSEAAAQERLASMEAE